MLALSGKEIAAFDKSIHVGDITLAGLPAYQYRRLQSVLNAASWLIYGVGVSTMSLRFCVTSMAPPYLCDDLQRVSEMN